MLGPDDRITAELEFSSIMGARSIPTRMRQVASFGRSGAASGPWIIHPFDSLVTLGKSSTNLEMPASGHL